MSVRPILYNTAMVRAILLFYDWPYLDNLPRYLFKPAKPVRHQQTYPVCGRKLVNTYRRDGVWKCRRCWEESGS